MHIPRPPQNNGGSKPARESGGSANIHAADLTPSRAGSLPQGFCGDANPEAAPKQLWERWCMQIPRLPQNNCGSGLARESGGSANINAADLMPSRAGSLPQGDRWCMQIPRPPQNNCGSEPARESGGSANINAADLMPSRAGSLPQGVCGVCEPKATPKQLCERACSRWRWVSQHHRN